MNHFRANYNNQKQIESIVLLQNLSHLNKLSRSLEVLVMNQPEEFEQLSTISERIKRQKDVLQSLSRFSSVASAPNQNVYKMIEDHQKSPEKKPSIVSCKTKDEQNQQLSQIKNSSQTEKKKYQFQRKTPIKQDLGFCGHILKYILVGFIIIFLIDFYYEIQNEIELKTKEVAQCYQDYHENNCLSPLDALVQECNRLQFCASRDPKSLLKLSNVFIKTFAALIGIVTEHMKLTGMIFIVVLLLLYFNRPTMYHEEKVYKYE